MVVKKRRRKDHHQWSSSAAFLTAFKPLVVRCLVLAPTGRTCAAVPSFISLCIM